MVKLHNSRQNTCSKHHWFWKSNRIEWMFCADRHWTSQSLALLRPFENQKYPSFFIHDTKIFFSLNSFLLTVLSMVFSAFFFGEIKISFPCSQVTFFEALKNALLKWEFSPALFSRASHSVKKKYGFYKV